MEKTKKNLILWLWSWGTSLWVCLYSQVVLPLLQGEKKEDVEVWLGLFSFLFAVGLIILIIFIRPYLQKSIQGKNILATGKIRQAILRLLGIAVVLIGISIVVGLLNGFIGVLFYQLLKNKWILFEIQNLVVVATQGIWFFILPWGLYLFFYLYSDTEKIYESCKQGIKIPLKTYGIFLLILGYGLGTGYVLMWLLSLVASHNGLKVLQIIFLSFLGGGIISLLWHQFKVSQIKNNLEKSKPKADKKQAQTGTSNQTGSKIEPI